MNATKVFHVARREFLATVLTRGFLIGLLIMPALLAISFTVVPKLMAQRQRPIEGIVAVVDPTGKLAAPLAAAAEPEAVGARRAADTAGAVPAAVRDAGLQDVTVKRARDTAVAEAPVFHFVPLANVADAREWLLSGTGENRLAAVAVHADVLHPGTVGSSYDLWVAPRLDPRVENGLYDALRTAIVAARAEATALDIARYDAMTRVTRPRSTTVTASGDQPTNGGLALVLPIAFGFLLFFGVMVGGQGLMTSTIEEKSSRVVEVLLSAVSPIELMTGKIFGQLAVSAVTLALYLALGGIILTSMSMMGLVQPVLIVYLAVFFVITYMTIGALMAAIGAAVNEMREAQSLMTPITLMIVVPMMLMGPILRNPNSTFATVLSLVPPMSSYAMLTRIASVAPPPLWQILLSIALGLVGVAAAVWFASKVFRVGLLMFGKPPDMKTLIRWVRMA